MQVGAEAEGELQALYDQLYDMANGDEAIEELKEQFFLQGRLPPRAQARTSSPFLFTQEIWQQFYFSFSNVPF